jgi:hypothetical protein
MRIDAWKRNDEGGVVEKVVRRFQQQALVVVLGVRGTVVLVGKFVERDMGSRYFVKNKLK